MISLGRRAVAFAIATACAPVASATRMRSACTAGIAAPPRQRHAERLGDAAPSCSRCPSPCRCRRVGASCSLTSLDLVARRSRRRGSCAPVAAAVGAGAEHARPCDGRSASGRSTSYDRRHVGRGRAHQLRRHRLVAAADQHHRVHRLRADHLLGVHRHQVAQVHAGRMREALVDRDGREIPSAARRPASRRASPPRSAAARCRGRGCSR